MSRRARGPMPWMLEYKRTGMPSATWQYHAVYPTEAKAIAQAAIIEGSGNWTTRITKV